MPPPTKEVMGGRCEASGGAAYFIPPMKGRAPLLLAPLAALLFLCFFREAPAADAKQLLAASGVCGGLVVHAGCGDGDLTAALRADGRFLVQGLGADVSEARENIRAAGLYGPVTARPWSGGRLP